MACAPPPSQRPLTHDAKPTQAWAAILSARIVAPVARFDAERNIVDGPRCGRVLLVEVVGKTEIQLAGRSAMWQRKLMTGWLVHAGCCVNCLCAMLMMMYVAAILERKRVQQLSMRRCASCAAPALALTNTPLSWRRPPEFTGTRCKVDA